MQRGLSEQHSTASSEDGDEYLSLCGGTACSSELEDNVTFDDALADVYLGNENDMHANAGESRACFSEMSSIVEEPSLQQDMNVNRESLKRRLMLRRSVTELVNQGIYPPLKMPPAFVEQSKHLERAKTVDQLRQKLSKRPPRDCLINSYILEDTKVDRSLQERARQLKRSRLHDNLNEHLACRPGPLELVTKNILEVDPQVKESLIEGKIQFTRTSEVDDPFRRPFYFPPTNDDNDDPWTTIDGESFDKESPSASFASTDFSALLDVGINLADSPEGMLQPVFSPMSLCAADPPATPPTSISPTSLADLCQRNWSRQEQLSASDWTQQQMVSTDWSTVSAAPLTTTNVFDVGGNKESTYSFEFASTAGNGTGHNMNWLAPAAPPPPAPDITNLLIQQSGSYAATGSKIPPPPDITGLLLQSASNRIPSTSSVKLEKPEQETVPPPAPPLPPSFNVAANNKPHTMSIMQPKSPPTGSQTAATTTTPALSRSTSRIKKNKVKSIGTTGCGGSERGSRLNMFKFHEYVGPAGATSRSRSSQSSTAQPAATATRQSASDTPYHVMLEQQQLLLQWQLELQQKNLMQQQQNSSEAKQTNGCTPTTAPVSSGSVVFGAKPAALGSPPAPLVQIVAAGGMAGLENMKVADLKAECKRLNLPCSGPKPNLIERLLQHAGKVPASSTSSIVPPASSDWNLACSDVKTEEIVQVKQSLSPPIPHLPTTTVSTMALGSQLMTSFIAPNSAVTVSISHPTPLTSSTPMEVENRQSLGGFTFQIPTSGVLFNTGNMHQAPGPGVQGINGMVVNHVGSAGSRITERMMKPGSGQTISEALLNMRRQLVLPPGVILIQRPTLSSISPSSDQVRVTPSFAPNVATANVHASNATAVPRLPQQQNAVTVAPTATSTISPQQMVMRQKQHIEELERHLKESQEELIRAKLQLQLNSAQTAAAVSTGQVRPVLSMGSNPTRSVTDHNLRAPSVTPARSFIIPDMKSHSANTVSNFTSGSSSSHVPQGVMKGLPSMAVQPMASMHVVMLPPTSVVGFTNGRIKSATSLAHHQSSPEFKLEPSYNQVMSPLQGQTSNEYQQRVPPLRCENIDERSMDDVMDVLFQSGEFCENGRADNRAKMLSHNASTSNGNFPSFNELPIGKSTSFSPSSASSSAIVQNNNSSLTLHEINNITPSCSAASTSADNIFTTKQYLNILMSACDVTNSDASDSSVFDSSVCLPLGGMMDWSDADDIDYLSQWNNGDSKSPTGDIIDLLNIKNTTVVVEHAVSAAPEFTSNCNSSNNNMEVVSNWFDTIACSSSSSSTLSSANSFTSTGINSVQRPGEISLTHSQDVFEDLFCNYADSSI